MSHKTNIKVLLVEDEAITALAVNMALENLGYATCPPAATGQQALESLVQEKPDVVLMDINLTGELDGIETARQMLQIARPALIFITGYSSEDVLEKATALNPIAIFTKPLRPQELQSAIDSAVSPGTKA
jgi:CheY-like chemotaxis protein